MILVDYTPHDWFWIVGGDTSRAWSSAAGAYVAGWDANRTTPIDSEQSLSDVLRPYGLRGPVIAQSDYAAAIQAHINETARAKGYGDGVALASYIASQISSWQEEASAFVAWRDSVWVAAYKTLSAVQQGSPPPTIKQLVASLPEIVWPS